jgi:sugar O-acyltransferase (sialic acid O-acetyltransferase NeuD family)
LGANKIRKLVLVGGAGTSSDVLALIASINKQTPRYEVLGLLDDALPAGTLRFGVPVLGALGTFKLPQDAWLVDCLGSSRSYRKRESLLERAGLGKERFETIIHPSALVVEDAQIGAGSIVYPNVVILSNVCVGQHVTILSGSVLNHDVEVDDWSIIGSGVMLSGAVKVGRSCYLGTASSVREDTAIGSGSLVAMGAVVTSNVDHDVVVAGVPAKFLRSAE